MRKNITWLLVLASLSLAASGCGFIKGPWAAACDVSVTPGKTLLNLKMREATATQAGGLVIEVAELKLKQISGPGVVFHTASVEYFGTVNDLNANRRIDPAVVYGFPFVYTSQDTSTSGAAATTTYTVIYGGQIQTTFRSINVRLDKARELADATLMLDVDSDACIAYRLGSVPNREIQCLITLLGTDDYDQRVEAKTGLTLSPLIQD